MKDKRVVLVDGAAGYWGERVIAQLLDRPGLHIIGLDAEPPKDEIRGLDFVQADVRNRLLVDLLKEEMVDTVCHLTFAESVRPNEAAFDLNVMGSMNLLSACAEAGVRKIVMPSSTLVYGAQPTNSAFLREDHPLQAGKSYGYIRDLVEIEAFCNGFQRQNRDIVLTILRFAHIVGRKVDTPMTRFLRDEEATVLMGFDPMIQVIHENDVVGALVHTVLNDIPGVFNVAAEGHMPLWRVMGLAGKLPIPVLHPLAYLGVSVFGPRYAPIDLDYLRYACVGDLEKMRTELQYTPQYTAEEALREFAGQQRLRRSMPEAAARAYDEERLRDTIERRRRTSQQTELEKAAPRARKTRRQSGAARS
jgi:UDP-glucose 4-epimerase